MENESPRLAGRDKFCVRELFQMERQRGPCQVQALADFADSHAFRPLLHQQPKDRQARFLGECGKHLHRTIPIVHQGI